jgi:hypothetical protein
VSLPPNFFSKGPAGDAAANFIATRGRASTLRSKSNLLREIKSVLFRGTVQFYTVRAVCLAVLLANNTELILRLWMQAGKHPARGYTFLSAKHHD